MLYLWTEIATSGQIAASMGLRQFDKITGGSKNENMETVSAMSY